MMDPVGTINILEWLKLGVEFAGVLVMLWTIVIRMPQMQKEWQTEREQTQERFRMSLEIVSETFKASLSEEAERHASENQEFRADMRDLSEKFSKLIEKMERRTKG